MGSCAWCERATDGGYCLACFRVLRRTLRRRQAEEAKVRDYILRNEITEIENILRPSSSARISAVKLFVAEYGDSYSSKKRISRRRIQKTVKDPVRQRGDALIRCRMEKYILRNTELGVFQPTLETFAEVFGCQPPEGIFEELGIRVHDD